MNSPLSANALQPLHQCLTALGLVKARYNPTAFVGQTDEEALNSLISQGSSLDPIWKNKSLEKSYAETHKAQSEHLGYFYFPDTRAKVLLEVGWKTGKSPGGQNILIPPVSVYELFKGIYGLIYKKIKSGELTWETAILPAIAFQRKTTHPEKAAQFLFNNFDLKFLKEPKKEYVFVRPGIDAMPDLRFFEVAQFGTAMDQSIWVQALSEGKIPLDLYVNIFPHDFGHIIDLFEYEGLMPATRNYYKVARRFGWVNATNFKSDSEDPQSVQNNRINIAAEVNSLPVLLPQAEIESLFPMLASSSDAPLNFIRIRSVLKQLSTRDLNKVIQKIRSQEDRLILRQGGVMLDPFNFARYGNPDLVRARLLRVMNNLLESEVNASMSSGRDRSNYGFERLVGETLHSLVLDIGMLDVFSRNIPFAENQMKPLSDRAAGQWKTLSEVEKREKIYKILIDRVARFLTALYTGNKLKITPAQVVRDISDPEMSKAALTARYFDSWTATDSILRESFVTNAKDHK